MDDEYSPVARWFVGDVEIVSITETRLPAATGEWLLPEVTPAVARSIDWLRPEWATDDGTLRLTSQTFGLVVGGTRILVDTGIGNGKTRSNPAWHDLRTDYLEQLTRAGFAPDFVDLVVLTHLHTDHVGWNTTLVDDDWVPTFRNARYVTPRTESAYWSSVDLEPARAQMFADSVTPVRDAGQLDLVDVDGDDVAVEAGIRLVAAPGHTPGQVVVEIGSGRDHAIITADAIHHAVQVARPDICSSADVAPPVARTTRSRLLARAATTGALVLGTHFAAPTAAQVTAVDGEHVLRPVRGGSTHRAGSDC